MRNRATRTRRTSKIEPHRDKRMIVMTKIELHKHKEANLNHSTIIDLIILTTPITANLTMKAITMTIVTTIRSMAKVKINITTNNNIITTSNTITTPKTTKWKKVNIQ